MRCEVLAVGTELLLGQIVDTNSAWIGEQLALSGIETYEHIRVGDNPARIVDAMQRLLERADAVIVCGGLGPTPDDITRECIAEVMGGVPLERRHDLIDHIAKLFSSRGRPFPENNLRQADVPKGARVIDNPIGTAPGLACPVGPKGEKIIYAVPGVPYEMERMVREYVIPDLHERAGERAVIVSRVLKTWGTSESGLAEMIDHIVDAQSNPTIAFLARGIEGIWVRLTARASEPDAALALIEPQEHALRGVLGDLVYATDTDTMESVVLQELRERGLRLAVAESVTGGLVTARLTNVAGSSDVLSGGVVADDIAVRRSVLGVSVEEGATEACAMEMADGVRRALGADVGLATTGVGGPAANDGTGVGSVWLAVALADRPPEAVEMRFPGDRDRIRQFATISLLNLLRTRLLGLSTPAFR